MLSHNRRRTGASGTVKHSSKHNAAGVLTPYTSHATVALCAYRCSAIVATASTSRLDIAARLL
jgi:hypothetical protein